MATQPKHILIIQGHPDPEGHHFGHALAEAYAKGAVEAGHHVDLIIVATLDFPLLRSRDDLEHGTPPDCIREAQSAMLAADHIVLLYPVWNGAMPALLKGFLEQTFRPAFIFPNARRDKPLGFFSSLRQRKVLKGKSARVVVTMQMPAWMYRWYFRPHPEKNTLRLSGIGPIKETLIGLVETPKGDKRARWLQRMHALGREAL